MKNDKFKLMTVRKEPKKPKLEKESIKKAAIIDTSEHIKKHAIIGETPKKPKLEKEVSKNNSKDNKKDNK